MMEPVVLIKILIPAGLFAGLLALERRWPAARPPGLPVAGSMAQWRRYGRNGGLYLLNALLSVALLLPLAGLAGRTGAGWRPDWWDGPVGLGLDLLVLEFLLYWWHRASHTVPLLWRFHEIHHLDVTLDTTSAVRFHFGEVLLSALVRLVPVTVLAMPAGSIILFETLVLVCALFHHANIRLPAGLERWLGYVIVTPALHWMHHHAVRADTDSNYGTLFSVWDRLFRSRSPHRRDPAMPIGVAGEADRPFRVLLLRPFRPGRSG